MRRGVPGSEQPRRPLSPAAPRTGPHGPGSRGGVPLARATSWGLYVRSGCELLLRRPGPAVRVLAPVRAARPTELAVAQRGWATNAVRSGACPPRWVSCHAGPARPLSPRQARLRRPLAGAPVGPTGAVSAREECEALGPHPVSSVTQGSGFFRAGLGYLEAVSRQGLPSCHEAAPPQKGRCQI